MPPRALSEAELLSASPPLSPSSPSRPAAPAAPSALDSITLSASCSCLHWPLSVVRRANAAIPSHMVGIVHLCLSALLFSLMAILVSLLTSSLPSFEVVFFRCTLQFFLGWAACEATSVNALGPVEKRPQLLLRGTLGFISVSAYWWALSHLPVAEATALFHIAPILTVFMASILLKEHPRPLDLLCVLLTVAGAVMVARPVSIFGSDGDDSTLSFSADETGSRDSRQDTGGVAVFGVCIALGAAVVSAWIFIVIRQLIGVPVLCLVTWMGGVGMILSPFAFPFQGFRMPSMLEVLYLLPMGLCSFLGQILFNAGVQHEEAIASSVVRNLDVAITFLFRITWLGQPTNGWGYGGAALVAMVVATVAWRKWPQSWLNTFASPKAAGSSSNKRGAAGGVTMGTVRGSGVQRGSVVMDDVAGSPLAYDSPSAEMQMQDTEDPLDSASSSSLSPARNDETYYPEESAAHEAVTAVDEVTV